VAEYITKTHAICVICGNPANYTQRKTPSKERVVVGAADIYEARCRNCFEPPEDSKQEIKFSAKNRSSAKETSR
ncbi:MAG: thymidine kinase, partial [Calditrichaeota bacterium]